MTLCNSNKPSLPLCPQREGGRGLGKEAMGGSNRNKKPSVLKSKRDNAGTEERQREARDQRPLPFYGDLPCEALDLGKGIQKSRQDIGAAPWLRAAVFWLLPRAQPQHPRMCISLEFFMNGAFMEEAPSCLPRSEHGRVWKSQDSCQLRVSNRSHGKVTTFHGL